MNTEIIDHINKESRVFKQIGGVLFGILIGFVITDGIQRGALFVFPQEKGDWAPGFWGSHHILRVIASIIGTFFGGYVAGCIGKFRGGLCGFLSALPTLIFWLFIGGFALKEFESFELTLGHWAVIIILIVASPIIGLHSGKLGALIRLENPEVFESRKNIILGIKWYHWVWLIFVIGWIGVFVTYSAFQGIWMLFGFRLSTSLHNILPGLVGILIFLSLFFLFMGTYKTFYLLSSGHRQGISSGRIAFRILGWTVGIWTIVGALQFLADVIFSKF